MADLVVAEGGEQSGARRRASSAGPPRRPRRRPAPRSCARRGRSHPASARAAPARTRTTPCVRLPRRAWAGSLSCRVASAAMDDPMRIGRHAAIPLSEIELRTSRSSGPGGQHANVTASRVEAVFDVCGSPGAHRGAARRGSPRGWDRWCGRWPRTRAASRATASWPSSGCAAGWRARSRFSALAGRRSPPRPRAGAAAESKRRRGEVKRLRRRPEGWSPGSRCRRAAALALGLGRCGLRGRLAHSAAVALRLRGRHRRGGRATAGSTRRGRRAGRHGATARVAGRVGLVVRLRPVGARRLDRRAAAHAEVGRCALGRRIATARARDHHDQQDQEDDAAGDQPRRRGAACRRTPAHAPAGRSAPYGAPAPCRDAG